MKRWPYILGDQELKPDSGLKPVFDRLSKDTDKLMKNKERESTMQFTYRDDVIVKKDKYIEYDFLETLRSDAPGDRDERMRQFSPSSNRKRDETLLQQSSV